MAMRVAANEGWQANYTNWRLRQALKNNNPALRDCPQKLEQTMEQIRRDLANAHEEALRNANPENPVMLTGRNISDFHNRVFRDHSALDAWNRVWPVFGGDVPGSNLVFRWCAPPGCRP